MKKKLKAALHRRRGISLAEVAVALAVIMLISAATMSLVTLSSRLDGEAALAISINEYAESALESFRWADFSWEFEDAMEILGFEPMEAPAEDEPDPEGEDETDPEGEGDPEGEDETDPEADSSNDRWYMLEGEGYRIEIRANLISDEFEINAVDENGEEIYRFAYEK